MEYLRSEASISLPSLCLRARPSYLISVPDGLHPGTPTPLAVTLLTDTPVRVTAEVAQANASLVRVEDTFPGGDSGFYLILCF